MRIFHCTTLACTAAVYHAHDPHLKYPLAVNGSLILSFTLVYIIYLFFVDLPKNLICHTSYLVECFIVFIHASLLQYTQLSYLDSLLYVLIIPFTS